MTPHTETQTGYGVLVTRKDGTKELWHQEVQPKEKAIFFKGVAKALSGGASCKVVRIKATWEVVE